MNYNEMDINALTLSVINKVRNLLKLGKYADCVNSTSTPEVEVEWNEKEQKLELCSVTFDYWDRVICSSKCLSFHTYDGNKEIITSYANWNELLSL